MYAQNNLILTCDLSRPMPPPPSAQPNTQVVIARSMGQEASTAMETMYAAQGFPAGWMGLMLDKGATAVGVLGPGETAIAVALITPASLHVHEIGRTFYPDPEGEYFFGDFVTPEWRGHGLQKLLIAQRLELCRAAGRKWAFAMMRRENMASVKSYASLGFVLAAEFCRHSVARWQFSRLRVRVRSLPYGRFSAEGIKLPFGWRAVGHK